LFPFAGNIIAESSRTPRKIVKNIFSPTHLFSLLAHGTASHAALRAIHKLKKSFKNICGKSEPVIFRIKFATSRPQEAGECCF
jgi:hypothetical protein